VIEFRLPATLDQYLVLKKGDHHLLLFVAVMVARIGPG
jgi:hypothetical protein